MTVVVSIASTSWRASAGSSTGVLPRLTMWRGSTRRAYARTSTEFFDWLEARGVTQITAIESVDSATYIEQLQRARSAPTVKLRLAALLRREELEEAIGCALAGGGERYGSTSDIVRQLHRGTGA